MGKFSISFGQMAGWIYDHRVFVLGLAILFLGVSVYFAGQVRTDNSLESVFNESDPTYGYYLDYQKDFGSDEIAYILYEAPDKPHGPFDIEVMRKIASLTEALENEVPFVQEVTTLANVEFIEAEGDDIEIHELLLDFPETQEELLQIRDLVMSKPIYVGSLINESGTHAAIILEMSLSSTDSLDDIRLDPKGGDSLNNLYPQVSNTKLQEILSRPEYGGITFYPSGDVTMNALYNEIISSETGTLMLATLIIVGIMTMVCFRMRFFGLVGPLIVVLLSLCMTVGFMGLMGYSIGLLFLMTPTLLIAIGVAQSVHLLSEFQISLDQGLERREALRRTLEYVGVPCLLAALTTAAAFLSMVVSELKSIAEFAVFGAVGVFVAFVLSVTLLLCILSFGRKKRDSNIIGVQKKTSPLNRLLKWVVAYDFKHYRTILIVSSGIFVVSLIGIFQLKIDFNFLTEFKEKVKFRQDTALIEEVMGGILSVVYVFDTGKADGIKDPEVLKQLENLQAVADQNHLVKKTYSIVDILKDINQSFHGGNPDYYRLPENRELISQYLLMYEMSGGKELFDYVTSDFSRTSVELRVEMTEASRVESLLEELRAHMVKQPVIGAQVKPTGIGLLWVRIADYIADSQSWGYLLAFSMIALLMCVVFRSVKVGLLAMIPNLAPVILTLGIMGWKGIQLDYFRMLLATIAIGIAVDDTVHLVARIRMEFLRTGDYARAIETSLIHVGRAITITSIVLISGFLVFLTSQMAILASFGILLAMTIATALISDLFLMPVLILVFKPFGQEFKREDVSPLIGDERSTAFDGAAETQ